MEKKDVVSVVKEIEKKLQARYTDQTLCNQYAWWIVEAITKKEKAELIAQQEIALDEAQRATVDIWLIRLIQEKTPLQYILGTVPFAGLEILVEPPILIPRPETEELCYNIIEQYKKLKNKKIKILDIGTGSGCIALSLAKAFPDSHVYATDISDDALALAQKNANHNKIKNVTFIKSDVYDNIPADLTFDFIVSNPPYIAKNEWKELDESVTEWEDPTALIAENKGLAIIEKIITGAAQFLHANEHMQKQNMPQLIIEIGYRQGADVTKLLETADFSDITIEKDLEEKDRFARGRVVNVAPSSTEI